MKHFFICLLLAGLPQIAGAQLSITPSQSAALLAQKLAGQGVTILNPVLSCDAYAAGIFKTSLSSLGLDSGILLSTGNVTDASGYASTLASSKNGAPGDPQLTSLAHAATYDGCRLDFDVIPKDDSLRFEYVFGSEEYNNATCGPYNDAFAFFISGPGIVGKDNMALVPGTKIPVAVNSINNGIPGPQGNISNCTSMGLGSPFTQYYVDNSQGSTLTYKGFTTVLRATHAVQPCATYHLQITIADAGNGLYDSGVFLKAGSLRTATYNISAVSSTGTMPPVIAPGCSNARITIKRSDKKPVAQSIYYSIAGNAQNGKDYLPIADSAVIAGGDSSVQFVLNAGSGPINGPKTVKLYLLDPYACGQQPNVIDSTVVTLYDAPAVSILTADTTVCSGDEISLQVKSTNGLSYSWKPAANITGPFSRSPTVRPRQSATYVLSAELPGSGCASVQDSVLIAVMNGPAVDAGKDVEICSGVELHLAAIAVPSGNPYIYSWIAPDGRLAAFDSTLDIAAVNRMDSGMYVAQALGTSNVCLGRDTIIVRVLPLPEGPTVISPIVLCTKGTPAPLRASGYGHLWYSDTSGGIGNAETPVIPLDSAAHYKYYVSASENGCESKRSSIDVTIYNCCGSELALPTAITPNGDGRNDFFSILGGAEGTGVDLKIFNRWGQPVFHGTAGDRWDGTQAGSPAPIGTYFYQISLDCRNGTTSIRKGELFLIR